MSKNMAGEALIPGVFNVGEIKKTDGCKQAAALAEKNKFKENSKSSR